MDKPREFFALLKEYALNEGFPLVGAVDLDLVQPKYSEHVSRFDHWLDQGHDAEMGYLRRGRDRRADPKLVFPEAQSVFCVAMPYEATASGETDPSIGPRYARYLRRTDYHDDIAQRLERVMKKVQEKSGHEFKWKVCVDTSAVLERSWAALSGLGWIGKNTLLIHPQYGSYLFLGEVLISEKTGEGPKPLPNYCGNCTRCLDHCPTGALPEPGVLKSNDCIAYWTLEKRGELNLSEARKSEMGTWIAGCDLCQEVCPFNTKPSKSAQKSISTLLESPSLLASWDSLLDETTDDYKTRIKDSALSRIKPGQFSRNLAITLSNAISETNDNTWAKELAGKISLRHEIETDPSAKTEWRRCLDQLESLS